MRLSVLLPLLSLCAAAPALAVDCAQEKAIYGDEDGAYTLGFAPVETDSAAISHAFTVSVAGTDIVLDGHVMPAGEPERTNGMIMNNCPEGDVTGEDIRTCTIWEGVVYAVGLDGKVASLPEEGQPAAAQLLLPDFGPSIRNSALWGKASVAPWDVLIFKGCGA